MNIGLIDYAQLEEFRLLAAENCLEISEQGLIDFVTDNRVYTAVKDSGLIGALIVGNETQVIGSVSLETYKTSINDDNIRL